jgi:hypothetical protein
MIGIVVGKSVYIALAAGVLVVHALFIVWVASGAFLTRGRPVLGWCHVVSLIWGILAEVLPCPLTTLEDWLESQAGVQPDRGGFLLHSLNALVYPNISATALTAFGIAVCVLNLAVHARRFWKARSRETAGFMP